MGPRWVALSVLAVALGACAEGAWVAATPDGEVAVSRAYVGESANGESAALYFSVRNDGPSADVLAEVVVEGAGWTEIHATEELGGMRAMTPVAEVELPPGALVALAPGGTHVMLRNLVTLPSAGDSLAGELRLRSGRTLPLQALVVPLTELESVLDFAPGSAP